MYGDNMHRTVIWSVVLFGSEKWALSSREKHNLWVLENRVQTTISGYDREG
jgi:hypothetical protein